MDPQLDNARNYVALVKMTLGAGTPQYKNFLDILKGYRTGEIAVYDVIDQISGLFQGDKELILGFNTFLPDDYKIELSTDDDDNDDVPEGTDTEEDEEKESDGESKQKISAKKRLSIPSNVIVSSKRRKIVHPIPKNRVTPSTRVVLSPLTSTRLPSDLLFDYDPLADKSFTAYPPQNDVVCKICKGATDTIATSNNELVLLCDQKGCNAEYHLGCLPSSLVIETNGVRKIPEGEIYCKSCAENGATTVLEKYFDRVDFARSHYSCSRAYVISLLENQMRANPEGNLQSKEKNGNDTLHCPPRSELWGAFELNNLTLNGRDDGETENDVTPYYSAGASFLVGKPVRLYNNLDNEYHVGRIVDWRSCSAYPDFPGNEPSASDSNTVSVNDLEYFGTGAISTCEFLVKFPAGVNGRRKELLKWIVLEEHSLAVGILLIQGKPSTSKAWTPAMVLARTSLELVPVRRHLHEDESGELFAKLKDKAAKSGEQRWALASFFGQETHALLDLNNEARDLMSNYCSGDEDVSGSETQLGNSGPLTRHSMASVAVPLALALAERDEQQRCKQWNSKILHDSKHPLVLVANDEYSTQLRLEKKQKALLPIELGIDRMWLANLAKNKSTSDESKDALIGIKYQPVASMSNAMALLQSKR